ncbi:MAG: septal ring lytic transglycosylase RlpA family protein [Solirubrobacteraceae bacterium]|nr:septal ring lytic transglycosylase RlpA family protein [Patulibacter sp.]
MPPSLRAFSRAALPMLAAAASLPAAASAQTAVASTALLSAAPLDGGVSTTPTAVAAGPAPAGTTPEPSGTAGSPDPSRLVHVLSRDLTTSGSTTVSVRVRGLTSPVAVELRVGSEGRKVDDAEVQPGERITLTGTANRGEKLHLLVHRTDGGIETNDIAVGTVRRIQLRQTLASWYGPGLFGQRTACGQTLTRGLRGVANKSLPCGTKLTVRYRGRSTQAVVVDRGPFAGAREFDLTYATAQAIGFHSVGRVWVSA